MANNTESNPLEANRLIKEFERRAKEAEAKEKGLAHTKTTRLIEKFEKKAQGLDDKAGPNGQGAMISNMKKMFEADVGDESAQGKPANVILAGSTNKLIERFQEPVEAAVEPTEEPAEEQEQPAA